MQDSDPIPNMLLRRAAFLREITYFELEINQSIVI